ncbi:MAG: sterol desaturase family protein [Gammaproteobacteria bacterium]|nr:sterol desaturase family protein [Gammaproteobacteria bacterium]
MPVYLQYYFWLIAVSLFCFLLERLWPWRKEQRALRRGIWQDLFWLVFNGHYLGVLLAMVTGRLVQAFNGMLFEMGLPVPESLALVTSQPLWLQFVVFFVVKDFVEWNIHRLLHLTPWLWEFHKLHHSIEELDWIGNFRFHWGEVVVYKTLSYLPLVVLGVDGTVILLMAIVSTLMQDLNHSNLRIDWGPLRYLFNSAKMHVWHHDVVQHGRGGQNFGIVLSVWDWIFRTAYWPADQEQPERLGFEGMEETYPRSLAARLVYPFVKWRR